MYSNRRNLVKPRERAGLDPFRVFCYTANASMRHFVTSDWRSTMVWGRFKTLAKRIHRRLSPHSSERPIPPLNNPYPIETPGAATQSAVDSYWGNYTIKSAPYANGQELLDF